MTALLSSCVSTQTWAPTRQSKVEAVLAQAPFERRETWAALAQLWASGDLTQPREQSRLGFLENALLVCGTGGLSPLEAAPLYVSLREAVIADDPSRAAVLERWRQSPNSDLSLSCPDGLLWL